MTIRLSSWSLKQAFSAEHLLHCDHIGEKAASIFDKDVGVQSFTV